MSIPIKPTGELFNDRKLKPDDYDGFDSIKIPVREYAPHTPLNPARDGGDGPNGLSRAAPQKKNDEIYEVAQPNMAGSSGGILEFVYSNKYIIISIIVVLIIILIVFYMFSSTPAKKPDTMQNLLTDGKNKDSGGAESKISKKNTGTKNGLDSALEKEKQKQRLEQIKKLKNNMSAESTESTDNSKDDRDSRQELTKTTSAENEEVIDETDTDGAPVENDEIREDSETNLEPENKTISDIIESE